MKASTHHSFQLRCLQSSFGSDGRCPHNVQLSDAVDFVHHDHIAAQFGFGQKTEKILTTVGRIESIHSSEDESFGRRCVDSRVLNRKCWLCRTIDIFHKVHVSNGEKLGRFQCHRFQADGHDGQVL